MPSCLREGVATLCQPDFSMRTSGIAGDEHAKRVVQAFGLRQAAGVGPQHQVVEVGEAKASDGGVAVDEPGLAGHGTSRDGLDAAELACSHRPAKPMRCNSRVHVRPLGLVASGAK